MTVENTLNQIIDVLLNDSTAQQLLMSRLKVTGLSSSSGQIVQIFTHHPMILEIVRAAYLDELKARNYNVKQFADDYGISRQTVYAHLEKLGLPRGPTLRKARYFSERPR